MTYREQVLAAKRRIVSKALKQCGTVSESARLLRLPRTHLHALMKRFGIESPNPARRGLA